MPQRDHSRLSDCPVNPGTVESSTVVAGVYYRTKRPTIVLADRDNHQTAVTVPVGKVIDVVSRAVDDRFLVVEVDGEQFQVFETDLAERCTAHAEQQPTSDKPIKLRLIRTYPNLRNQETRTRTYQK